VSLVALGVIGAVLAATLYNGGIALQALEARETPPSRALRPSLLAGLALRRRWLVGTLLVTAGWGFQAAALLVTPLTVVQPILAVGLVLLLVVGTRILHERVGAREIAAVASICAGLVALTLAAPEHTLTRASGEAVAVALVALGSAALLPYLLSGLGRRPGVSVVFSAGLVYAWCGITTKLVADAAGRGEWGVAVLWVLATAVAAGVGLLSEMTALQTRPATGVAPVVLVVDIVAAVAFAGALVGERWDATPLGGAVLLGGVVLLTGGAAVLASSPAVAAAGHPEAAQAVSES
jgi:drug/metabolite transporter (DMT)-like permease